MNNFNDIFNDIFNKFEGNKKLKKAIRKLSFHKIVSKIVFISSITIAVIFGLISFFSREFLRNDKDSLIFLLVFSISSVLVVLWTLFYIFVYRKKEFGLRNSERNLYKILYKDNYIQNLYKYYFTEKLGKSNITDLKLNALKPTTMHEKRYGVYGDYYSLLNFPQNIEQNRLEFKINDQKALFIINSPIIVFQGRSMWLSYFAISSIIEAVDIEYVSSNTMLLQSKNFDASFKGVNARKGKAGKDNYQSESVEFNKNYRVNTSATDIRAAKFFSPKVIDAILNEKQSDLLALGFEKELYIDRVQTGKSFYPIGTFEFTKNITIEELSKRIAKKIESDYKMFEKSLKILDLFA
ncbi:hypothetical protein SCHIN_v1c09270 [Spiroplasma chinense]|uniref:DUF3137 domain-containing protein n=1 Tax=Spiroplasma chinense TaxID=216932 RepID=A0A5B9Y584_9MOLU|nr:hypothetical protein [Spiroplasma chinense]QEH62120.1 hypothetical protein SCHIN_v1c09270 [Spiroplasma chinense]